MRRETRVPSALDDRHAMRGPEGGLQAGHHLVEVRVQHGVLVRRMDIACA